MRMKIQDAKESNAGDDFHIVWTVRKSMDLLNFEKDGLKKISLEGMTTIDNEKVDADGDVMLGVDLTEYYGGEDFETANKINISQLKYSTRHPNLEWTAARVCRGKKKQYDGSIIQRLAHFFKGLFPTYPRDAVLRKTRIKLVSNRPVSQQLANAVVASQEVLAQYPGPVGLTLLKKHVTVAQYQEIEKLQKAASLKNTEFADFLRLLDFSDCSAGPRIEQKKKVLQLISESGSVEADKEYDKLRGAVWDKMMPDPHVRNDITISDILFLFGCSSIENLFPVPQAFARIEKVISREQLPSIITEIQGGNDKLICLHGGAGTGKSTIAKAIEENFREGNTVLLFDCYGAGAYLTPEDKRHKHANALLHLINELALKIGTPLLLVRNEQEDFYIQVLKKRLELASQILHTTRPGSKVIIIIDAADNSTVAAEYYKNKCFVHDLVRMILPDNCKIIVTTRTDTERKDSLNLPTIYKDIEVNGFSQPETSLFIANWFKNTSEDKIAEFRRLTYGIPRVMAYVMELTGKNLDEKLNPLKPDGKTLDDIFKLRILEAEKKSGSGIRLKKFLTYLINLPRPVPIDYLQKLTRISKESLADYRIDLWHGLVYEHSSFSIRDEDFETFLRSTYSASKTELSKIADEFLLHADDDEYASTHLGNSLYKAERKRQLQDIVIERKYLNHPVDSIKNKEVFIERARLAMMLAKRDNNNLNFLKLLAVAAEAAKTNKILEEILLNKADLAVSYGNLVTIQKMYFQQGNPEWFGPVHFRSAAIFSRKKETHSYAKEHLAKAEKWLQYRNKLDDNERQRFDLTSKDVAFGAEAVLKVLGPTECITWIERWIPLAFRYAIVADLLPILISNSTMPQLKKWCNKQSFRVDVELLIVRIFFENGLRPPIPIERISQSLRVLQRLKFKSRISMQQNIIAFCEYALINGIEFRVVEPFLDLLPVKIPEYVPSFYDHNVSSIEHEKTDMDFEFRKATLKAIQAGRSLEVKEFYPERITKYLESEKYQDKQRAEEEKRKFDQLYRHMLPVYEIRAKFLLKTASVTHLKRQLKQRIDAIDRDYDFYHRHSHHLRYIYKYIALKLLDILFYCNDPNILQLIRDGFTIRDQLTLSIPLSLAEKLSSNNKFHKCVLQILRQVEEIIDRNIIAGDEKIDYYTRAATIGARISEMTGKYYFDKMVDCASEIDLSAYDQIKCINYIVKDERTFHSPRLAFEASRFIEFCYEHLRGHDHFPWEQGFQAICKLDIAFAFTILSRWDHRNIQHISSHFTELMGEALQQDYLTAATAAALFPVNKYYWPGLSELVRSTLQKFDEETDRNGKNIFLKIFLRDLKVNFSPHHYMELLDKMDVVLQETKFIDPAINSEFKGYYKKIQSLRGTSEPGDDKQAKHRKQASVTGQYKKLSQAVDVISAISIDKYFSELKKLTSNGWVDDELALSCLKQNVGIGQHTSFLEALIDLNDSSLDYWSFKTFFMDVLAEWDIYAEVRQWKKNNFTKLITSRLDHFMPYDSFDLYSYRKWAQAFEVDTKELAKTTISILPDYIEDLSSKILYQVFDIVLIGTTFNEKTILLEWLLARWNKTIKDDFGDGPFSKKMIPAGNATDTIANFIRYNLGHPDKRLRWRVCHSLRRFALFGQTEIFDILLKKQDSITNHPFQHQVYPFYQLSAKLYLWIAIDRICAENPEAIFSLKHYFISEFKSTGIVHAQILYFVKNAANKLIKKKPDFFKADELLLINNSLACSVKSKTLKNKYRKRPKKFTRPATTFRFDSTDTVPYWYEPLGRIFGISGDAVAKMADRYITEKWSYAGNPRDDDHVNTDDDYYLTSNDHGSEPTIETLRKYYEYHAMFCVATELLRTKPVVKSDSYYEKWEYWISGWGLCCDDFWLADFRDPFPAIEKLWRNYRNETNWEWSIERNDFNNTVGLKDKYFPDYLVVHLGSTIYYGKDYESSSVKSALVHPQTAPALLRALQTSSRYEYQMPMEEEKEEQEDDDHEETSNDKPNNDFFKLEGWIRYLRSDHEGIDDTDESYSKIDKGRLVLGNKITQWGNLHFSTDYRYGYKKGLPGSYFSILEVWNDIARNVSYGEHASGGVRLLLKKKYLLSFLKETDRCLIIKCEICRHPHTGDYNKDLSYYTLLYLIYPNGKITTISGDSQLR